MTAVAQPPAIAAPTTSRSRRTIETTVIVAIWVALGIGLHLSARAYLLLGIPLTAAFQWLVRREPLRALWVRDPVGSKFDARAWMIAAFLVLAPAWQLMRDVRAHSPGVNKLFDLAAVGGAFAAAYALRNFRRAALKPLMHCLAIAGAIGIWVMVAAGFKAGFAHYALAQRFAIFGSNLLVMIPLCFVVEEVSFRGAFDAHLHHPGEPREVLSAVFVSALWGLWHLPVVLGQAPLLALVPQLLAVHCAVGIPLSIYWRRSGNLFVTGSTHALIDAVRNALLVLPWH